MFIPRPYHEEQIPSIEQDEQSQLHFDDLFTNHSCHLNSDKTASVDLPDSSLRSVRRRQTSTMEIERSQQSPAKVSLDNQTVSLIVDVVRAVLREEPDKLLQERQAGLSVPLGQVISGHNGADLMWNAAELGFFNPNYNNQSENTASNKEHLTHGIYFNDVHTFIKRAKDMMRTKGEQMVRCNLSSCFRGSALEWYLADLSPYIKSLVQYGTGIDEWENQLLNRFKLSPHIAMRMIFNERYTMEDARRHREPRDFAEYIIQAGKDAELTSPISILSIIYNGMDAEFQKQLPIPTSTTSTDSYLQMMDERKNLWWTLASRGRSEDSQSDGRPSSANSSCHAIGSNANRSFYQETRPRGKVARTRKGSHFNWNHLMLCSCLWIV